MGPKPEVTAENPIIQYAKAFTAYHLGDKEEAARRLTAALGGVGEVPTAMLSALDATFQQTHGPLADAIARAVISEGRRHGRKK